jgi:hypothetical protein
MSMHTVMCSQNIVQSKLPVSAHGTLSFLLGLSSFKLRIAPVPPFKQLPLFKHLPLLKYGLARKLLEEGEIEPIISGRKNSRRATHRDGRKLRR